MKFFFELVSCCGVPAYRRPAPAPEDEMRWLVVVPTPTKTPAPQRSHGRRKRGRVAGSRAAEGEWKPSLCAISEDNVVAERAVESERMAKRKIARVRVGDRDRDRDRSQSDGFGRNSTPPVMPTFSPTPFMF